MENSIAKIICYALLLSVFSCNSDQKKNTPTSNTNSTISDVKKDSVEHLRKTIVEKNDLDYASTNSVNTAKTFLREYFKEDISKDLIDQNSRNFILEEYDLNDDGKKEFFIGLTGPYFCGSGGCTCLLLNDKYQIINYFTVTDFPISISKSKQSNWADLIIESGGKYHLLQHNGVKYPSNPSIQKIYPGKPADSFKNVLTNLKPNRF